MRSILLLPVVAVIAACGTPVPRPVEPPVEQAETITQPPPRVSDKAHDVVLYALGLIDTGYRFGGKNPEAGLDCSGMVSYVFERAAGVRVSGNAATIARQGRVVAREQIQPGDLVFFNTQGYPFSHVGIYIGDDRFVHAPRTNAKVRIDRLTDRYFARRFEAVRTYFN